MQKHYLAILLLALSTTACTNNTTANTPPTEKPVVPAPTALTEIQVANPIEKYKFSNWNTIFGLENSKNPMTGNMELGINDRVAVYGSVEALQADLNKRTALMPAEQASAETKVALVSSITQAYSQQVDFKTQDLIVVHLTAGGPPFGEYGYKQLGNNSWEFCIPVPANKSGISGMALQTQFKFYTAPKGAQASRCKK